MQYTRPETSDSLVDGLLPHQLIPYHYLRDHWGLLLYHSTGSGKTRTALMAMYQHLEPIEIIGPKSARRAFLAEISQLGLDMTRITFHSYTRAKELVTEDITYYTGRSVIVDEAHYLRTENMLNIQLLSALEAANHLVLLSATPIVNTTADLAVLVNLIRRRAVLPTNRRLFDALYLNSQTCTVQNETRLKQALAGTISYYQLDKSPYYPRIERHVREVVMDAAQLDTYGQYVRQFIYRGGVRGRDILDIDFSTLASSARNHFLTATRQLSNTSAAGASSPKLEAVLQTILDGPRPAVVFSFYLEWGIFALAPLLVQAGLRWSSITGVTGADLLTRTAAEYNRGLYDVLLLSSAGSESLDLRGTRQLHVLESQWNTARGAQAEGRASRYGSHLRLSERDRTVHVYYWLSVFPPSISNLSADQYLWKLSQEKRELAEQYDQTIEEASIERELN